MSTVGTAVSELESHLKDIAGFKTAAFVRVDGFIEETQFTVDSCGKYIRAYYINSPEGAAFKHVGVDSIHEALAQISEWFPEAELLVDTITIMSTEKTDLRDVVRAVWCQVFPRQSKQEELQSEDPTEHRKHALKAMLTPLLRNGQKGIATWNARAISQKQVVDWTNMDLSSANLKGIDLSELNWCAAKFDNAKMEGAKFKNSTLEGASFQNTDLSKSNFEHAKAEAAVFANAKLVGANFSNAELTNAVMTNCDLRKANFMQAELMGVDLSTAKMDEKTRFGATRYDESTKFPPDFDDWALLWWRGKGQDPYEVMMESAINSTAEIKFKDYLAYLDKHFDFSKVQKALSMMKKERFQLFTEVTDANVVAVIKSQTDKDLVYAALLNNDGMFSCCTQNLKVCGGLKGSLCKHHLVMLMGLVKYGELNANTALKWALKTIDKSAKLDKDAATDIFVKYKGLEAGEIDWRPIETLPEDYYAF